MGSANGSPDPRAKVLAQVIWAMVQTVRDCRNDALGGIPESYIHIALQERGMSFDGCCQVVELMIGTGQVRRREDHLLIYIGD